ncbi:MAG: Gfo/Idh/MocA family oxidoreductase [Gorillibacterium sp.]|nr:Gfo/Idh/MocA family oxidoreductase [Gorillibacterium sp.]
MMKIAVLGTGFGSYHVQLLQQINDVEGIIVFGRNESKLQKLRDEFGVEVSNDIAAIMLDPEIDVIDICLPPELHRQYAVQALAKGKQVFCETPVCLTLEDARAMKQAEEQYDGKIIVNQFIKFDPPYQYLYAACQEQKYGKLLSLSLKRETPPLWGDLGFSTIATNLMIHELDFVTWLLGAPNKFNLWGAELANQEQALVRVSFEHQDILTEVITSSQMPDSYPFTVGYEAYFEQAKLVFTESDYAGRIEVALDEYTALGKQSIVLAKVDPFAKSLEHALHCFQADSESQITLDQAIQALELALEIKERLKAI